MTIREIVEKLGGSARIARHIGKRPTSVRNWVYDGYVPPKHHAAVIDLANQAGFTVTPAELDPEMGGSA